MTSKSEVMLEHFYIFNGTYAKKEGEVNTNIYMKEIFFLIIEIYTILYI